MSIVSSGITLNTAYNVTGDLTGNLIFQSNGTTEAVRIDTNQNVGIGTANPGQKLEVNGWVRTGIGASATGGLELPYYSGSASSRTWRLRNDVSAYGDFSIAQATTQGGATYDNKLYIDASGNVGLGTVSPTYKLNVTATNSSGDNGAILVTSPSTDGTQFRLNNTSASGHSYTFYSTGSGNGPGAGALGIYDQTAGAYRSVISPNGGVYFSTTGLTETWNATTGTYAKVGDTTYPIGTTAPGLNLILNRNTSTGQIQEFKYNATAVGNISVSGSATAYNTSSDYRLKENIVPMTDALAKVAQLKPVTYKWKVDGSDGEGFIAHELAEVCPQAVEGAKDAVDENGKPMHQSIDTSFLVATLTAAIQELKAIVDAQAIEIAELKGKA